MQIYSNLRNNEFEEDSTNDCKQLTENDFINFEDSNDDLKK